MNILYLQIKKHPLSMKQMNKLMRINTNSTN